MRDHPKGAGDEPGHNDRRGRCSRGGGSPSLVLELDPPALRPPRRRQADEVLVSDRVLKRLEPRPSRRRGGASAKRAPKGLRTLFVSLHRVALRPNARLGPSTQGDSVRKKYDAAP